MYSTPSYPPSGAKRAGQSNRKHCDTDDFHHRQFPQTHRHICRLANGCPTATLNRLYVRVVDVRQYVDSPSVTSPSAGVSAFYTDCGSSSSCRAAGISLTAKSVMLLCIKMYVLALVLHTDF